MKRSLGFGLLWAFLTLFTSIPLWVTLPEPGYAHAIRSALQTGESGNEPGDTLSLPLSRPPGESARYYRLEFEVDVVEHLFLFIPVLRHRAVVSLNGSAISDTENRISMMGLASGVPALIPLPAALLRDGNNVIDLQLEAVGLMPTYLSAVYVGTADELAPYYRIRVFVLEYLKAMAVAVQLLITLTVFVLWLYRPADSLFGWLTLLLLLSMVTYLGMMRELIPQLVSFMPYFTMIGSSAAIVLIIVALQIAGHSQARWLCWMSLWLPVGSIALAQTGILEASQLALLLNAPLSILGLLITLGIIAWAALRHNIREAWLLLLPILMTFITAMHDLLVVLAVLERPVLLSVYYRPLLLIGFAMILMRRLGISLITLDDVNHYLKQRLAQQEQDLERLYQEEKNLAAQSIRSEERQRLTKDLHDGLSGHLVSIIALSKREHSAVIEHSAREALDDLRLVIHSLDIDENELPIALSGFRERLERQLKRLDITLDWSIVNLPEISGVTPTHALNVLRVLQEAITNAITHGRARKIIVRGSTDAAGQGVLMVENDGHPFTAAAGDAGKGLSNMRRRVLQLGGSLTIKALPKGTRLQMVLPLRLPAAL